VRRDDGKWVTITARFLSTIARITVNTAGTRIRRFMDGRITVSQLLARGTLHIQERKARVFERDEIRIQCHHLIEHYDEMPYVTAYARLIQWEKGVTDCDTLFAPIRDMNMGGPTRWDEMQVGPRRDIEDIPISSYEREMGAKIDKRHEEARNAAARKNDPVPRKAKRRASQSTR